MSFLAWHREGDNRLASTRRVLRAAEVPLLQHANELRDLLERRRDHQVQVISDAATQARMEGHAEGLAAGQREAQERLADELTRLHQAAACQSEAFRNDSGALALQVVRKLLGQFADDAVLVALAETATAELLPGPTLVMLVHPRQADAVAARLDESAAGSARRWEVRADPALAPDACRIETEHGSVEVTLEAQLARLAAAWSETNMGERT